MQHLFNVCIIITFIFSYFIPSNIVFHLQIKNMFFHTLFSFAFFFSKFNLQILVAFFVVFSPFSFTSQEVRGLRGLGRGVRWAFIVAVFEQPLVRLILTLAVDNWLLFKKNCLRVSYGAFLDSTAFFHMWIFVIAPIWPSSLNYLVP